MSHRARGLAWTLSGATITIALARVLLAMLDPASSDSASGAPGEVPGGGVPLAAFEATVLVLLALIGGLVAARHPRNAVGWILGVIPLSLGLLVLSAHAYWALALRGNGSDAPAATFAWLASWVWIPAMAPLLTLFPLLFPTGRLLSRRWRPVLWMALAGGLLLFIGEALSSGRFEDYPVGNPIGLGVVPSVAGGIGFLLVALSALASLISLLVRARRSRGEEREQLKWVACAAVVFVVIFALPTEQLTTEDIGFATLLVGVLVISSAVAVSILRFRLYDIDVVINRTLVYGSLTAVLAGVYVSSVLLLQLALSNLTEGSGLAVAASTLATAALVRPGRASIQAVVDRRFFRQRYDASRTLERFGTRLRDEVSLDVLSTELRNVVVETVQPTHVTLWLRDLR